ncbi:MULTISPECIES: tRNA pseudouridine(55) synthase TruB [Helicobacter]|uniref:tRNA pseudouridine synthase B n=1 Tax=Helicobacter ibis TaxID=2962633 RepID=A0ABT4VE67_9HELI|nr:MULTISPECIES: tRNA pseudouridine(55) synthase TruB [Helicobacter]MDA3966492.1 tRNA pseudouridine(55) synthase TruB [Helicobacter sp. WB40]MDA3968892.1 tRNA pseudouridine(55) synthase TruB [Helicobacter ibis]
MNKIFVAYKPIFVSSNSYLSKLKKRDRVTKAGFSGTLDPFACGALLVAYGKYTRLFQYINKTPKVYRATLFLGLESDSLDIENIKNIHEVIKFDESFLKDLLQGFIGKVEFIPPKYSAKKINGVNAYKLAREGHDVTLKKAVMEVFFIKFLNYSHPFLSFEVGVSEGGYIRSLGELIANRLGSFGSLSYLERISEGTLSYEGEKPLNPLEILNMDIVNINSNLTEKIQNGKKLSIDEVGYFKDCEFILKSDEFFSIVRGENGMVEYLVNNIPI